MRLLEAKSVDMSNNERSSVSFVRGETQSKEVEEAAQKSVANPDEIELDDEDDESSDEDEPEAKKRRAVQEVETQAIPSEVFGGLKGDE